MVKSTDKTASYFEFNTLWCMHDSSLDPSADTIISIDHILLLFAKNTSYQI